MFRAGGLAMPKLNVQCVAFLSALLLAGAATPAAAQTKVSLVFSSGPLGGSWVPLAASAADAVRRRFPEIDLHVEPGAGLANMEKIITDKTDLGWSMTALFFDARAGRGRWKDRPTEKLLHVATLYPNVWHLAVPATSGITKFTDLRGKAVALPQRANTSFDYGWEVLLRLHGMTLNDLGTKSHGSFVETTELVKNRNAVAAGWLVGVPAPFMLDLGSSMKLRLLPVAEDVLDRMRQLNSGFVRHVIPRGVYAAQGIDEEVVTFQIPLVLIAAAKTPPEAIYKVTKVLVEERKSLVPVANAMKDVSGATMAQSFGMPYHPGAERYYREVGLLR
jgi:TRAP transporter TAXI family solute receptor